MKAHPRGCGEKPRPYGRRAVRKGSPPRVRGKENRPCKQLVQVRITPAGAGKSKRGEADISCSKDHPRGCGEKSGHARRLQGRRGSPPRVRGKEVFHESGVQCGGSPPRVRGKVRIRHTELIIDGITPAGAGKSRCVVHRLLQKRDHPRGCGEKPTAAAPSMLLRGSPPRVRGKGCGGHSCFIKDGITPAGAGKRLKGSRF